MLCVIREQLVAAEQAAATNQAHLPMGVSNTFVSTRDPDVPGYRVFRAETA